MSKTHENTMAHFEPMMDIQALYISIVTSDCPPEALKAAVESNKAADKRESIINALGQYVGFEIAAVPNTIAAIMAGFLAGNPTEEAFYQSMWSAISADGLFPLESMKVVALGATLVDPKLPYHVHELLELDEESYAAKLAELNEPIGEMRRIVFRRFAQKTEEASALLEVIESHDNRDDRVVLLGNLLAAVRPPEPNYNV